jgi:hypothetical protein
MEKGRTSEECRHIMYLPRARRANRVASPNKERMLATEKETEGGVLDVCYDLRESVCVSGADKFQINVFC